MPEVVEQPKVEAPKDAGAILQGIRDRREAERTGKPVPKVPQPEVRTEAATAAPVVDDDQAIAQLPRQVRRQLRDAQRKADRLEGELAAYKNLGTAPHAETPKPEVSTEEKSPTRAAFAKDEDYYNAISQYYGKKAGKEVVNTAEQERLAAETKAKVLEDYKAADAKVSVDKDERFPDWKEVAAAALEAEQKRIDESEDGKDPLRIGELKTKVFNQMFHLSKQKAALMYHFAKNPEALGELLEMEDGSVDQILAFKELEGEVKVLYPKKQKSEPVTETAAERDAKKHKPSSAGAPTGGSAPVMTIQPILADGTINPAWKAMRAEQRAARR